MKKILKLKEKIIFLLRKNPSLRDSDNKLIANIWYQESGGVENKMDFLRLLADGKLTSSESIRRSRQKIQEKNLELRGKTYAFRKKIAEPRVREEIRNDG